MNLAGEVVGLNARKLLIAESVGFAIPVNLVKEVVTRLIANGHVERSAIGLECQPLPQDPTRRRSVSDRGLLVSNVIAGSPAEVAGIRAGDVLTSYDGAPISALFDEELPATRKRMTDPPVGKTVDVIVRRDGDEKCFRIVTQELGRFSANEEEEPLLGLTAKGITEAMARERQLPSTKGVL